MFRGIIVINPENGIHEPTSNSCQGFEDTFYLNEFENGMKVSLLPFLWVK